MFIEKIKTDLSYREDFDWKRIISSDEEQKKLDELGLDIFISHGQIGTGQWREGRIASQSINLFSAAVLASKAKVCVDGHLHTTFEMINALGKPCIRAVGNKGYLFSIDDNKNINWKLIEVDAIYDGRGSLMFDDLSLVKKRVFL